MHIYTYVFFKLYVDLCHFLILKFIKNTTNSVTNRQIDKQALEKNILANMFMKKTVVFWSYVNADLNCNEIKSQTY